MLKLALKKVEEYRSGTGSVCKAVKQLKKAKWIERELNYLKVKQVGINYDTSHDALFALALTVQNNLLVFNEHDGSLSVVLCYDHTALTPTRITMTTLEIEKEKYYNVLYKFLETIPDREITQQIFKGHRLFFDDVIQTRRSLISRIITVSTVHNVAIYVDTTYHEEVNFDDIDQLEYLITHVKQNVDRLGKSVLPFRLINKRYLTQRTERMWDECFDKPFRPNPWMNNVQIINSETLRSMGLNTETPTIFGNTILESLKDDNSSKFDGTSARLTLTVHGIECPGQAFLFHTILLHPKLSQQSQQQSGNSDDCMGQLKIYLLVTQELMVYAYITLEHADSPPAHLDAGLLYYLGFHSSIHKVEIGSPDMFCVSGYGAALKTVFNFPSLACEIQVALKRMMKIIENGKPSDVSHSSQYINPFDFLVFFTPSTMITQSLPTDNIDRISRTGSHRVKCLRSLSPDTKPTLYRLNPFYYQLPCSSVIRYNQVGLNFHECTKIFFLSSDICDSTNYYCNVCHTKYTLKFCAIHCGTLCHANNSYISR